MDLKEDIADGCRSGEKTRTEAGLSTFFRCGCCAEPGGGPSMGEMSLLRPNDMHAIGAHPGWPLGRL